MREDIEQGRACIPETLKFFRAHGCNDSSEFIIPFVLCVFNESEISNLTSCFGDGTHAKLC